MTRSCRRCTRAFTLVELLVVIGIIAALIGILLPVLSGVSARGRDIKCQSNLRQIVTSLLTYAQEHKGSFPYGFIHNNANNQNPNPSANDWNAAPGNSGFFCWASMVGRYTVKGSSGMNELISFSAPNWRQTFRTSSGTSRTWSSCPRRATSIASARSRGARTSPP
jgi:prepilin-type N-terminal cleavage/methylation domain-containing protein